MVYTKEQVIQFTINILSAIRVPAMEAEEIGTPILKAIKNLMVVQEMMEAEKNKQQAEKKETIEDESMDVGGEENVQTGR
jgi:hypothetical protein